MRWSVEGVLAEMRLSLQSPREGARRIIALNPPMPARWIGLALIAIAGTFLTLLSLRLVPPDELPPAFAAMMAAPLDLALGHAVVFLLLTGAIYAMGRAVGGQGSFADSLTVLVWFQLVLLCVQLLLLVVQLLVPPLVNVTSIVAMVLFFWLLTGFIAELHGFRSLGMTFLGIIAAMVILALALTVVLATFVGLTGGVAPT